MGPGEFILSCCREEGDIVVKKYLIDGESYFFSKLGEEPYGEFHFKKDIAAALKVHIRDIVIVGSAKLGFSIKPQIIDKNILYLFKEFDSQCREDPDAEPSDIDVAIVSDKLFNEQLENLYEYTQGYKSYRDDGKHGKLADYVLKGWLRPDYVPRCYCISTGINKVLEGYRKKYKRKVNIGIYKSWFFFENYHKNNIQNIKLNHISNI